MSSERLFDFRTVDGHINRNAIAAIREVESRFNCFPPFVGIAVRGSTTRGYCTEHSDLDLVLLHDSSISSPGTDGEGHTFHLMKWLSKGSTLSTISRHIELNNRDINLERVNSLTPIPAEIFMVVTGSKIAQYRKLYSDYIKGLPKEKRDNIIREMARELVVDDSLGWRKMAERISGVPMSDYKGQMGLYYEVLSANGIAGHDEYESERYKLWEARIKRLLTIGPGQLEKVV